MKYILTQLILQLTLKISLRYECGMESTLVTVPAFFQLGGQRGPRNFRGQVYIVANNAFSQYRTHIQCLIPSQVPPPFYFSSLLPLQPFLFPLSFIPISYPPLLSYIHARWSGERCKLPSRSGWSLAAKCNFFVNFGPRNERLIAMWQTTVFSKPLLYMPIFFDSLTACSGQFHMFTNMTFTNVIK